MVAGGASTATGTPPVISQVPPHCADVSGPQPVVSGRELGPPPPKWGPGLVATLLGPLVHCPLSHRPLAHCAAFVHALPLATLVGLPLPLGDPGLPEPPSPVPPHAAAPMKLNQSAIAASVE